VAGRRKSPLLAEASQRRMAKTSIFKVGTVIGGLIGTAPPWQVTQVGINGAAGILLPPRTIIAFDKPEPSTLANALSEECPSERRWSPQLACNRAIEAIDEASTVRTRTVLLQIVELANFGDIGN
jgi:hypothetical protein